MEYAKMNGRDVLFMKSMKKKNKLQPNCIGSSEDDVWDDSVLVAAYNKAVNDALAKVLRNMSNIPPRSRHSNDNTHQRKQWKVGDHCRCEFTEDHIYYEANIIDLIDDLAMCIVKYVGYENEEKVHLSKLKPSKGEMARTLQMRQALQEKDAINEPSDGKQPGSGNIPQPGKKKSSTKPENLKRKGFGSSQGFASSREVNIEYPTSSHMFKPPIMGAIPPPPPPQMFTNKLDDDALESDAMSAMLMSWYMSGYHTGFYQGLKAAKK